MSGRLKFQLSQETAVKDRGASSAYIAGFELTPRSTLPGNDQDSRLGAELEALTADETDATRL